MKDRVVPLGLKLAGRRCLVVGSGEEAERRALTLARAGARVQVVSERPAPGLEEAARTGDVSLEVRPYEDADFDGIWLAILGDMNEALAERMARAAEARRVFFCAVDQPAHSTFSHLALAESDPVVIAVSTNGRAPALARRLRDELERLLRGADVGGFVERLVALRGRTPSAERRDVLGRAVSGVRITGELQLPEGP